MAQTPEGMLVQMPEANATLVRHLEKASAKLASSLFNGGFAGHLPQSMREKCHFAACAWVDEVMLNSPREDAHLWMANSLQHRFYGTSDAGDLFFVNFDAVLRGVGMEGPEDEGASLEHRIEQGLTLCMKRNLDTPEGQVGLFYAQCLLFGFCGRYYNDPAILNALRKAAADILAKASSVSSSAPVPEQQAKHSGAHVFEMALYIALPLVSTVIFGLYCSGILANIAPFLQ